MSNGAPLQGKRILVTRAQEQASEFSSKIKALGGIPVEIPLIKFQAPQITDHTKQILQNIHTYSWIVFTSVNGVNFFFDLLEQERITFDLNHQQRIAVVGKKTRKALEKRGLKADLIPPEFVAESLLDELLKNIDKNDRVLLARGNLGRSVIPEKLKDIGIHTDDLVLYETVINRDQKDELLYLILNEKVDMITFTSSSTVTHFLNLLAGNELAWREHLNNIQIACIGPITEETALEAGITPDIIAKVYTMDGLLEAIVTYLTKGELSDD